MLPLTIEELRQMQSVSIDSVKLEDLTDLRDVKIDITQSVDKKMQQFASQTTNLFVNRVGDYIVKVSYMDTPMTINDKMAKHIQRLAEINY